jgi:hypothetical protein
VLVSPEYVETQFPDGTLVPAVPEDTDAYRATARSLGYGADTARMNREHDPLHSWLAEKLGLPHSPVLWAVAHGTLAQGDFGAEEALTLAFQRLLNHGTPEPALRPLEQVGHDLDQLYQEATALLREVEDELLATAPAHDPDAPPGSR